LVDATSLPLLRTVASVRAHVAAWRERGQSVALVPTMGALHDGHLSLVRMGRAQADRVIASVFVNPRQFAPAEDFDAYPRDEMRDAELLAHAQCDAMYCPSPEEMYPAGFATTVSLEGPALTLEGAVRPIHFAGVATVVAKLLGQVRPDVAIFGEKDYQQLMVVKRMARDLDLGVEILGAPTLREADGLAMSSRNAYLSAAERVVAGRMNQILAEGVKALAGGADWARIEAECKKGLEAAGFQRVDYVAVRDANSLAELPPGAVQTPARILAAASIGRTRLIDNMAVG
jgi:pantoate--beta-alanine ligase